MLQTFLVSYLLQYSYFREEVCFCLHEVSDRSRYLLGSTSPPVRTSLRMRAQSFCHVQLFLQPHEVWPERILYP